MRKLAFILTTIAFLVVSCDTEQVKPDYRDKYTGNYSFNIKYSFPVYKWIDSIQTHIIIWMDSSYSYIGSIVKTEGCDNTLFVDWGNDTLANIDGVIFTQKNNLTVDPNGILSYPEYFGSGHTCFYPPAYIKGDTIRFKFGSRGEGMYSAWDITGLKISR